MIAGIFHEGSGLGDQLFRYITIRTLAEKENKFMFGMKNPENFKGKEFMPILSYSFSGDHVKEWNYFEEKVVRDSNGNDIRSYDPEINFVQDNTIIDGSFEDDKYWRHNLKDINEWLAVEPLEIPDDYCLVGFRGGEYYIDPNLGLSKSYFDEAMNLMKDKEFQVHTDDVPMAMTFFPDTYIVPNVGISHSKHTRMDYNWRFARYAKCAIIPNSAFFIIPRILKHIEDPSAVTIAPRYWARRNTKVWSRPACYYPEFRYI